ncbi:MAG: beta-L-arabinofuranosidase domain-containing protein [Bacteroidales bacterium]
MNKSFITILAVLLVIITGCSEKGNKYYSNNPAPLLKNAYIKLPLGAVKPEGWLRSQLEAQAAGLTGNLDEFWPDLVKSAWTGGDGEGWERGPYYLDGLVPLAFLLDDQRLMEKSRSWMEHILTSSRDSGWYGPVKNKDRWPLAVANKVLMQYYEATGDKRAIEVLKKYFRYLHLAPPDWGAAEWRGVRAMENAVAGYWLYRQTREPWILETIASIQKNSPDWTSYYETFPWDSAAWAENRIPLEWKADGLTAHGVNNAMAIKYPGLWFQQSGDTRFRNAVFSGIEKYDRNHGQAGGRFSCDEHLSGKSPDRGTELCSVVEYMFSLEELYEIFGDNSLADRLEMLAYNSLPGTFTPDMWAHQYDQQSNQVLVSGAKRNWTSNKEFSNIYGLMPNFACCLANMHQGWPKYVESMWMATNDNGLAAVLYGPSKVKAKTGNGNEVTITEETDYPFKGTIKLTIATAKPARFPLYMRVPAWSPAKISAKGKSSIWKAGSTARLDEKWQNGDQIIIGMPLSVRYERRFNYSISILRGPLYFSLRIDKEYKNTKIDYNNFSYKGSVDWEIYPKSDWNYSLMIDRDDPDRSFEVTENEPGRYPFADKGDMVWSSDSLKYTRWTDDAPVVIRTRGMKAPEWKLKDNSADIPPLSPVKPSGQPTELILVPYGCARLRITEFPLADITFMKNMR